MENNRVHGGDLQYTLSIAPVAADHLFQRIPSSIDCVIVAIRISGDEVAVAIPVVLIVDELLGGVRGADLIDDDLPPLQPLHPVIDGTRTLDCGLGREAEAAVVGDGLFLGGVACDLGVGVAAVEDPSGGLLVGHVVGAELIQEVDSLGVVIVVKADESERIREPAPVGPLVDAVEGLDLIIRDRAEGDVVEDVSAGADRESEILVLVAAEVALLQLLCLGDELIAKPGGIVQIEIAAAVLDAVGALLSGVLVGPVVAGQGRVVSLEVPEVGAAAHGGLENRINLGTAGELVLLLEVRHTDVAEGHLDGLDLHGIVCPTEEDPLAGRAVDQLERTLPRFPELGDAEHADGPDILGVDGVAHGVGHLAEHQGVDVGMLHQEADDREGRPGGLETAAAAGGLVVGVAVLEGAGGNGAEVGGDVRQIVCAHDGQRADLFPV